MIQFRCETKEIRVQNNGGMIVTREDRGTLAEKLTPVSLCLPQIPLGLSWDRYRASSGTDQGLTAYPTAGPTICGAVPPLPHTSLWHEA